MTQGLLSIVCGGKVVVKIVTGADGRNIVPLASSLREKPTLDPGSLLARCREHDLDGGSLIIQTSAEMWMSGAEMDEDEELPELYRTHFHDPRFNPRWENGTAEYTELVELNVDVTILDPSDLEVEAAVEIHALFAKEGADNVSVMEVAAIIHRVLNRPAP